MMKTLPAILFVALVFVVPAIAQSQQGSPHSGIGDCIAGGQVVGRLNANAPPTCTPGGGGAGTVPSTRGGTGVASPTAHTIPIAEGASAFNFVACAANLPLIGVTGADPACTILPVAGGGTGVATASANTVFAGPTSGAPAAPTFRVHSPLDIPGSTITITNDTGTGTTVNGLAKYGTSGATAVITTTADTVGILGVVISGAGTSGSAAIQVSGLATCTFDATAVVYQDYVQNSSTTGGACHDAGASYPTSGQVIGRVNVTGGAGSLPYQISLAPFSVASTGGGGGSGTVNSGTGPQIAQYLAGTGTIVGPATMSGAAFIAQGGAVSFNPPYSATSYTAHGLILGEGGSNLAAMAACATGHFLYGQTAADPVCSTLMMPNAATQGDILTATSANTVGSVAAGAADTLLQGKGAGTVPGYVAVNNCATELTYSTGSHTFGCAIPVTTLTGTANQIAASASTGAVTLSLIGPYTPATYTAHGVLLGETTSSIVATAAGASGAFLYGQGAADPVWSTLLMPNAATTGDILYASGTNQIARLADVATGQVLASGGVGTAPAFTAAPTLTSLTTTGNITDGNLTVGGCVQAGPGGILTTPSAGNCSTGGSGTVSSGTQGQLAYYTSTGTVVGANGASTAHGLAIMEGTGAPAVTSAGPSNTFLYGQGGSADPIWSTLTLPNAATTGDILYANASNAIGRLTAVTSGSFLYSQGTSTAPVWSTLKLPNAATTGDLLAATSTNTVASVPDVAVNQVLTSGGVGAVPVYSATPVVTSLTASGLTPGNCVQAGAGGLLTTSLNPCGTGGGYVVHTVTGATPSLTCSANTSGDVWSETLANATTTPALPSAAAANACGGEGVTIFFIATQSIATSDAVGNFTAGVGAAVVYDNNSGLLLQPPQNPAAAAQIWYQAKWDAVNAIWHVLGQETNPSQLNPYDLGMYIPTPTAATENWGFTCDRATTFPANLAGATATCGTNPGQSEAFTLNRNGSAVATLTLSTACGLTLSTQAAFTCNSGDALTLVAPATVTLGKNYRITVPAIRGPTSAGVFAGATGCSPVNGIVTATGCSGADIGAQTNAAIAALPIVNALHTGTVYIPPGTYSYSTTIVRPCSVTIAGNQAGGTFLTPNAASMDGIATIGPSAASPTDRCFGGVRDITFMGDKTSGTGVPANVNLIHISNTIDQTFKNVITWGWGNVGDRAFYVDGGDTAGTTFSEGNTWVAVECKYQTSCWVFDGNGHSTISLAHNTIVGSKCGTSFFNLGFCYSAINQAVVSSSYVEFSYNLNLTGSAAIFKDATGNANGLEVHVQGEGTSGATQFNSASGPFSLLRGQSVSALPIANAGIAVLMMGQRFEQLYSVAGVPLPACSTFLGGIKVGVTDATLSGTCIANSGLAYTGSSNGVCEVYCDGGNALWKLDGLPSTGVAAHF